MFLFHELQPLLCLTGHVLCCVQENTRLSSELENTRRDVANEGLEHARLQDLLEKVQADKKRLSGRVSKLLETEKDLVLEIDRLKHHRNGTVHSHSHNKKAGKDKHIEDLLRGLEQERDYYKNEVSVLQQLLKPRSRSPSPSGRVSRSSTPAKRISSPSPSRLDKKVHSWVISIDKRAVLLTFCLLHWCIVV